MRKDKRDKDRERFTRRRNRLGKEKRDKDREEREKIGKGRKGSR